jgi:hypothetical protein
VFDDCWLCAVFFGGNQASNERFLVEKHA